MKTKCNHFKRITAFAIAMALLLAVAISCKKTDDTPAPTPPAPYPPPPTNLFHSGFYKMMTDEEIMNHKMFGGSYLYRVGSGLTGENVSGFPYSTVVKTLWSIQKYQTTSTRFDKISNELDSVGSQMKDLTDEVTYLSQQLSIVQTNIFNKLNSLTEGQVMVEINTAWDNNSSSSLLWYPRKATEIANGTSKMTMEELDNTAISDFISKYGSHGSILMQNDIGNLQRLLLGSANKPEFALSSIKEFADAIIQSQGKPVQSPAYAMNCYKLMENYFLLTLNAQFRALTVYGNALYREKDTIIGNEIFHDYLTNFKAIIQSELSMFLTVTDYLSINLLDYRAGGGFSPANDLRYFNYGLRPDDLFAPVIARANMLNQLMNQALELPTKDVYLTISVPKNYSNSAKITWTALNPYPFTIDNYGSLPSQYPYTGWSTAQGQTGTCSPDNSVTFYRSNEGTGGSNHVTMSSIGVQLMNIPWRVRVNLEGSIPVGYYNPNDISAAPKSVWSSTYSLCFGSASVCWYWGYLWLNDNMLNNMQEATDVLWQSIYPSDNDPGHLGNSPMMYGNSNHIPNYGGNFSHGDWNLEYYGTFPTTSGGEDLLVGELRSASMVVNNSNTTYDPTIAMFLTGSVSPFNWSKSVEIYFAGTEMQECGIAGKKGVWTNADMLNYKTGPGSKYFENINSKTSIKAGNHTFNVGFYAANPNETGNTNNCEIIWYSQVIYNGTYNIWSK